MNEDKASRYHRLKRWASVASLGWSVLLLGGLLATGRNVLLRNAADAAAVRTGLGSWRATATVFDYVILLSLLHELGSLPLGVLRRLLP